MKQVVRSARSGELAVKEVPSPILHEGGVLVRTGASLVSAGTERLAMEFAGKNLAQKALARPDLARQTVDRVRREGLLPTVDAVRNRLDVPTAMGYSSAGVVVMAGPEANEFQAGERVACAGQGYASHAEVAYVPHNLAVRLPSNVSYEAGAFTTLGAIALQGVRRADATVGARVAVIGLGLVGQLTVQLLRAAGCSVFGVDVNQERVALALSLGADAGIDPHGALEAGRSFSNGLGFDAVIITAGTESNEPVAAAGELARDRGVVVVVGAVGLQIPRKSYYEKELDLRLSRSYGPGRYDPEYEEKGHDYPFGYVRWTEQRNMEAFAHLLSTGAVQVGPLISHRFSIDDAQQAYDLLAGKVQGPYLGILLTYDMDRELPTKLEVAAETMAALRYRPQSSMKIGVVGAGAFANGTLLPAMKDVPGVELVSITSASGMSARSAADRFDFRYCVSTMDDLLGDPEINCLAILTRHNLHAHQAIEAMRAGKDVFVEKPLALTSDELQQVLEAQAQTERRLAVGFNRRFASMVQEMKRFLLGHRNPLVATYRVNAGFVPPSHWTQDPAVGGGRLIGEGCHFIDLLMYLIDAVPVSIYARAIETERGRIDDQTVVTLTFADGSVGVLIYAAGGNKAYGKERIEVIGDGKVAILDDFRQLEMVGDGRSVRRRGGLRPDKGHRMQWVELASAVREGRPSPLSIGEIRASHLATYAAAESLRRGEPVEVVNSMHALTS